MRSSLLTSRSNRSPSLASIEALDQGRIAAARNTSLQASRERREVDPVEDLHRPTGTQPEEGADCLAGTPGFGAFIGAVAIDGGEDFAPQLSEEGLGFGGAGRDFARHLGIDGVSGHVRSMVGGRGGGRRRGGRGMSHGVVYALAHVDLNLRRCQRGFGPPREDLDGVIDRVDDHRCHAVVDVMAPQDDPRERFQSRTSEAPVPAHRGLQMPQLRGRETAEDSREETLGAFRFGDSSRRIGKCVAERIRDTLREGVQPDRSHDLLDRRIGDVCHEAPPIG